ncbi:unnamed protein product [Hermetia illucens]|uniref:Single domain-containing protein n=1 Tax=Hermetia illucens TaxID=343691 RepID=A0A7R8UTG6_HERIL|nr:uncharacterized protein LOC119655818 [Hermetia illucens]CAD7086766.1 unnamed protein product [Hermetia illucens]
MQVLWVIMSLIIAVNAYESYLPNSRYPGVDDKCYLKETKEFIDFGNVHTPVGICQKFTCRDDFVIRVDHCSRYMVPEGCEVIPTDLTQPFPECCVKLKCVDHEGNTVIRNTA